jgi:CDGSH-type Zn-finger protein
MADPTIKMIPNGPYRVTGPAKIIDTQGNEVAVEDGRGISLCRCGASANKPYCDGTHGRIGFQSSESVAKG